MKLTALVPFALLAACSQTPAPVVPDDTGAVEKMAIALPDEDEPEGRQPGEFVVTEISGSYRAEPVVVRREVIERDGDEIVIEVSVDDEPRLRLRVDDHPRRRGQVLAAWHLDGEKVDDAPLSAYDELMAELYMSAEANDGLVDEKKRDIVVGTTELRAIASTFDVWVGDEKATMRRVVARDFAWGELEFELRRDEAVLFRAAVVDHGRREAPVAGVAER